MDKLFIAGLYKKRRLDDREMYICEYCGVIVGVLFGTHFLSSRSIHYLPMIRSTFKNSDNMISFDFSYDYSKDKFLSSNEVYCYYDLEEVVDYSKINDMIFDFDYKFKGVSYFINLEDKTPYMFRYKG